MKNIHDARRVARGHDKPTPEAARKLTEACKKIVEGLKKKKD